MALIPLAILLSSMVVEGPVPRIAIACEQVEVYYHQPGDRDLARRVGRAACTGVDRMRSAFGHTLPGLLRVRITANMGQWRRMTGRPWYVAAAVVGGDVLTQPPHSLRRLADLEGTIHHEVAHLFIRHAAGRNCPRWLEEGLAHCLAEQSIHPGAGATGLPGNEKELASLEARLTRDASDRVGLQRDYAICLRLVRRVTDRVGIPDLVRALRGLRRGTAALDLPLGDGTLRDLLF